MKIALAIYLLFGMYLVGSVAGELLVKCPSLPRQTVAEMAIEIAIWPALAIAGSKLPNNPGCGPLP